MILGLNPNLEGDSTTLYLADVLAQRDIQVTRLARGLPSGSQLEFANNAILADALHGRQGSRMAFVDRGIAMRNTSALAGCMMEP